MMTTLSPEIEQAARALGQALRAQPAMEAYLAAAQRVAADAEASELEKQVYAVYEALIARQQAGEQIPRAEIQAFYTLRDRFFSHPLVEERENALQLLKGLLLETAARLSEPLGVDYTILARKDEP